MPLLYCFDEGLILKTSDLFKYPTAMEIYSQPCIAFIKRTQDCLITGKTLYAPSYRYRPYMRSRLHVLNLVVVDGTLGIGAAYRDN